MNRIVYASLLLVFLAGKTSLAAGSFADVIDSVQPRIVKIYGSGGLRGLEAYQSGFLISAEGHVLTVWSYVLDDPDFLTVVLDDGRRFHGTQVKLVGNDPRLEIAILKIDAADLPHFPLDAAVELGSGARVLAFSNLFGVATGDEPASVLHGNVAARTRLSARRGAFQSTYRGEVYVVDAMTNNPGAAGGALTDRRGKIAGLLGKELRSAETNTWLNYAVPIEAISESIHDILAGRIRQSGTDDERARPAQPLTLSLLGVILVPDVLPKTPPFVDRVVPGSPAEKAGLRADDLVLFVNDQIASSHRQVVDELSYIDRIDPVRLTLQRGQELLDVELTVK